LWLIASSNCTSHFFPAIQVIATQCIEEFLAGGLAISQALKQLKIHHWYYKIWKQTIANVNEPELS
jgi:hypothetical protein